jgi:hypothetical protein
MTITKRSVKGSALTYEEMDENIRDLVEGSSLSDGKGVSRVGERNLIINGGMNIWQRASASTQITQSGGAGIEAGFAFDTQDRWSFGFNDGNQSGIQSGNLFSERSTDVPAGQGFSYSTKITKTGTGESGTYNQNNFGDSGRVTQFVMRHIIEAQNCCHLMWGTSDAKPFTFSFWVKSSQAKKLVVGFQLFDAQYLYATTVEINATDTWEKKIITIPGQTDKTINNDNGQGIGVYFSIITGTSVTHYQLNTWYDYSPIVISPVMYHATSTDVPLADSNFFQGVEGNISFTGCQLEIGDVATGFEFEPFETTLRKCQRYYEKSYEYDTAPGTVTFNGAYYDEVGGTNYPRIQAHYGVRKRTRSPTSIVIYNPNTGTSGQMYVYDNGANRNYNIGNTRYTFTSVSTEGQNNGFNLNNRAYGAIHYAVDCEL